MAGADDLRPLDAAIDEIRILREAAEHAADRIGSETRQLRGGPGTEGLVADVADALVERTETIREDCERLDGLLRRARGALAASAAMTPAPPAEDAVADVAPVVAEPLPPLEPGAFPGPPRHSDAGELERRPAPLAPSPSTAEVPPDVEEAPEPPAWQFWRRRRRPARPSQTPPRLPRPDYGASGLGTPRLREERVAPGSPPVPEGVRLIATQMAIAGASRIEIERRLQRQFGITDSASVLDEIFGAEAPTPAAE